MNHVRTILEKILDALFPPLCISCMVPLTSGEKNAVLCPDCTSSLMVNNNFFRIAAPGNSHGPFILGAALDYGSETVKKLIRCFKYNGYYSLSRPFADLIMEHLRVSGLWNFIKKENFILLPIPLHISRLRYRGYNQSELIGIDLSELSGMEICRALIRTRKTREQAEIKGKNDRLKNVSGCFLLRNGENVRGKNIALLDDVFTSGATIMEAARVLYRNGAKKVIAITLAKA